MLWVCISRCTSRRSRSKPPPRGRCLHSQSSSSRLLRAAVTPPHPSSEYWAGAQARAGQHAPPLHTEPRTWNMPLPKSFTTSPLMSTSFLVFFLGARKGPALLPWSTARTATSRVAGEGGQCWWRPLLACAGAVGVTCGCVCGLLCGGCALLREDSSVFAPMRRARARLEGEAGPCCSTPLRLQQLTCMHALRGKG